MPRVREAGDMGRTSSRRALLVVVPDLARAKHSIGAKLARTATACRSAWIHRASRRIPAADHRPAPIGGFRRGPPYGCAADRPWTAPATGIHPRSAVDPGSVRRVPADRRGRAFGHRVERLPVGRDRERLALALTVERRAGRARLALQRGRDALAGPALPDVRA